MTEINMREYVLECIKNLCERYRLNQNEFEYESYFHSDLYFILNYKNKIFWKEFLVSMGENGNFKGTDLIIKSPYKGDKEIFLEIKHFVIDAEIKKGLKNLSRRKKGHKMFLYVAKALEKNKDMLETLNKFSKDYSSVEIVYYHPDENIPLVICK